MLLAETDEALVAGVICLLRDADLRQSLRRNGRRLIEEHFTWERVAGEYEALYRQVAQERSSNG